MHNTNIYNLINLKIIILKMKYELPKLEYNYDALEPFIDAKTMEIHHTKHHQAYIDKLNEALEKHPEIKDDVEELLKDITKIPEDIRIAVRNHGGGHVNHSLFWQLLKKDVKCGGKIAEAIEKEFGNFEKFKEEFSNSATRVFGSGWAWLSLNDKGKLEITNMQNQDNPLLVGKIPILGLDVWEHAYYLKYQNKRADYVNAFWNIINWTKVNEFYEKSMKK